MAKPTVQTNLHGRRCGLSNRSDLIFNDNGAGKQDAVLRPKSREFVTLAAAAVAAAFTTPVELIAAPGAGIVLLVHRVVISKAAGTAFGGIAAGEDITIVYAGGTAPLVTDIETTGFLDSVADEMRISRYVDPVGTHDLTALANTAVDFELLVGDITLGSDLIVDIEYEPIDLTALTA